jgi:2-polyprenyl-6-methoxyphenol hydroxylase-like FAD-dependent oxidoreductase
MKVLIAGCGLAGLATALGLVTKFVANSENENENENEKNMSTTAAGGGKRANSDTAANTNENQHLEIVIVERRDHFQSRGATFGLAPNGQISLQEIAPPSLLQELQEIGIFMAATGGYMLPWWKVRDALLQHATEKLPYKKFITIHRGCMVKEVIENSHDDDKMPLKVSFESSTTSAAVATSSSNPTLPTTQAFDLMIGADGVHSHIRTHILKLPPAVSTDTRVWRGSVIDTCNVKGLGHFSQEYPVGTIVPFGENIIVALFNFHSKLPGTAAWVCTCRNASTTLRRQTQEATNKSNSNAITPLDLIQAYTKSLTSEQKQQQDNDSKFQDAQLLLANTSNPLDDLTWSTEMAVVDLDEEASFHRETNHHRWGGRGRITLVGDAAHSIRPASGLGGSLAFEDATILSRCLLSTTSPTSIAQRLTDFETQRLPRCRSLSRDQTLRSTLAYTVGFANIPPWDPQYRDWVFQGPNASPHPPVDERAVFESILQK